MATPPPTIVLTGATSGVGRGAAIGLARRGVGLVLPCRDPARATTATAPVSAAATGPAPRLVRCDLADRASVRDAAADILERCPRIDALVHCAGVTAWERREDADGVELTWSTNVLGTVQLTGLLLDRLTASAPSRVVVISGNAHRKATIRWDDPMLRRGWSTWASASQAALARVLWTFHLARRLDGSGVTANTFCPGFVKSGLTRGFPPWMRPLVGLGHLFAQSEERGGATAVQLALDPALAEVTGRFYRKGRERPPGEGTRDPAVQDRLAAMVADGLG